MSGHQSKIRHYRFYLHAYGKTIQDVSRSDQYITSLINGEDMDDFEYALRAMIERSPKKF